MDSFTDIGVRDVAWGPERATYIIHDHQIAQHGGASGIRDVGLLEYVVARMLNMFSCEAADIFTCSAAYVFGFSKILDSVFRNKQTSFMTAVVFIRLDRFKFISPPEVGVEYVEHFSACSVAEINFEKWLQAYSQNND